MTNMKFIAHRGNLFGPNKNLENKPNYIDDALNIGYDAEIDIWNINNLFYLGHDDPRYIIDDAWLNLRHSKLWIHAKNIEALYVLKNKYNVFSHDKDDCVLTSKGYIWVYPGKPLLNDESIAVLPEIAPNWCYEKCFAVCSDFISYKK